MPAKKRIKNETITKEVRLYIQESPYGTGPGVFTVDMREYGYTLICERVVEVSFPAGPSAQQKIEAKLAKAQRLKREAELKTCDAEILEEEARKLQERI